MPVVAGSAVNPAGLAGYQIGYSQITASVNITGTTEGTATTVISPPAFTFDGKDVYAIFFSPGLKPPGNAAGDTIIVGLFESGTLINRFGFLQNNLTNAVVIAGGEFAFKFTPSAASHTYVVAGWVTNTTNTPLVAAGVGGPGANPPAYVRFVKA